MIEYKVIESENLLRFNKKLSEEVKNGWTPYMSHTVYVIDNNAWYSITLMRSISQT